MTSHLITQVVDPRDHKTYVFHRTVFRRLLVGFLRLFLRLFFKINIQGLENLPEEGPVILASNHLTNFDVLLMQMVISRPLFFMAKSELHRNPIMDVLLRKLGTFPVKRGERDQWALQHAQKVLGHDQVFAIFPEGTRSKGRGLKAGKSGAARIAIMTGSPIMPVGINGSQHVLKHFPKRTQVQIVIGKPIYPKSEESTLGLTDRLMFTIAELLPPELRGVYIKRPIGF